MFIADVVNVKADDKYLNAETGKFELSEANPVSLCSWRIF
mgnify:CR=1 FL=1